MTVTTKTNLEGVFSKDYYQQDYLSQFKMRNNKANADVSVIIPTFNRCPFEYSSPQHIYNPLAICLSAFLMQKTPVNEIIIIDDGSTDFTKDTVENFTKKAYATKGIKIIYFKNEKRMGSSVARNIGAKHAKSKYLFFLDDDCAPAPYLIFIAMIAIGKIEKKDHNFASLILPVYDRASYPLQILPTTNLTKSFFKREDKSASFNSFPAEYLEKPAYIHNSLKIFSPIQVFQSWGHFIANRSKYLDVGGFPDFAVWPNKAGEEQEFACRLIENAYTLYYLPDPKASSFHGAYGLKVGDAFTGKDWMANITHNTLSLSVYSEICDNGIMSGNRVNDEDFFYSKIIATFCILYKRNTTEAIKWAKYTYQKYVTENQPYWSKKQPLDFIDSTEKRQELWYRAISDGLQLLLKAEQKKMQKLRKFIKSLKEKDDLLESKQKSLFEILQVLFGKEGK